MPHLHFTKIIASRNSLQNILEDEIANYSSLGHILLQETLTVEQLDVSSNLDEHIPLPTDYEVDTPDVPVSKQSEDNVVNNYGKELLEPCITGQLIITCATKRK